jgi:selenocysteine lyase/cysteine desulfurase
VAVSFYKIFGYPTGVGALLVRKSVLPRLRRPWFAGGTVEVVTADYHWLMKNHEAFEDGTISYLSIPAITIGLNYIQSLGLDEIHAHVLDMTKWLLEQMTLLHHDNGRQMVQVLGPVNGLHRGGTIALVFFDPEGEVICDIVVGRLTCQRNISVRNGCFCNPGNSEMAFHYTEVVARLAGDSSIKEPSKAVIRKIVRAGGIRVSVGFATTFRDVYQFWRFCHEVMRNAPAAELIAKAQASVSVVVQ